MGFLRQGNDYYITIITSNHDNFLGISFAENSEQNPEVHEIDMINLEDEMKNLKYRKNPPSKEEILKQVLALKITIFYF